MFIMLCADFAKVYSPEVDLPELGEPYDRIAGSSAALGRIVLGAMNDAPPDRADVEAFYQCLVPDHTGRYARQLYAEYDKLFGKVGASGRADELDRSSHEHSRRVSLLNYQIKAQPLTPFVNGLLHPGNPTAKPSMYDHASDNLAYISTELLRVRMGLDRPPDTSARSRLSDVLGVANELDTSVVLIEAAKSRPSLRILPAPIQMEAGPDKKYNADLLAIDTATNQAVGIQVKTRPRQTDAVYDKERIVVVSGSVDLYNALAERIEGSTRYRTISMAGMLSAHRLIALNPKSSSGKALAREVGQKRFTQSRMYARQKFGHVHDRRAEALKTIEAMLAGKLGWKTIQAA